MFLYMVLTKMPELRYPIDPHISASAKQKIDV